MSAKLKKLRSPLIWLGVAVIYALPFFGLKGFGAAYIKFGSIKGESTDAKHIDEIDVLSWSWGATNPASPMVGVPSGSGKATLKDFTFSHEYDLASPLLALRCFDGQSTSEVVFTATKPGPAPLEYLVITFNDCVVTAVSHEGTATGVAIEDVSFTYKKIHFKYSYDDGSGKIETREAGWNVEANEKL